MTPNARFVRWSAGASALLALVALSLAAAAQSTPTPLAPLDAATSVLLSRGLAAVAAGPQAGWIANGTATISGGGQSANGTIEVDAWGASHCKVTISLSLPGRAAGYELIANGRRHEIRGSGPVPLPPVVADWALGCAILPQGLPWADIAAGTATVGAGLTPGTATLARPGFPAGIALALDPSTALPATAAWSYQDKSGATHQVALAYADYQSADGASYPSTVTETLDGTPRLTIHFDSFAAHAGFTDADFPLPPPTTQIVKHGGAQ